MEAGVETGVETNIKSQPKTRRASPKWIASRPWLTETLSAKPDWTIHHPIKPWRPPRPNSPRPCRDHALKESRLCHKNQTMGRKKRRPRPRAQRRWSHSQKKMNLNSESGHGAAIAQKVLGRALIELKNAPPLRIRERRDHPHQRTPLHHRETRICETRDGSNGK